MSHTHRSLSHASRADLEAVLRLGRRPNLDDLAGGEFRGFNTPLFAKLIGVSKFKKGFYRPQPHASVRGYNIRTKQSGYDQDWVDVLRRGEPLRHGFYAVVEPYGLDNLYPNAVLIDYSQGGNPVYDPTQFLRDYLVQVDPGNPDLFLGKAYVAVGTRRLPVSYFVLERCGPSPLHEAVRAAA